MKISEITESNIYSLKTGRQVTPEPVSMKQAFGHPIANSIEDLGAKFVEKPDYWEDLDSAPGVDQLSVRRISNYLHQQGLDLTTYSARDIYGATPNGPTAKVRHMPEETVFVVDVSGNVRLEVLAYNLTFESNVT